MPYYYNLNVKITMMSTIILSISILLTTVIFIVSLYFIIMYFTYANNIEKLNKTKSKLKNYKIESLITKLKIIKEQLGFVIEDEEINKLNEQIDQLKAVDFKKIKTNQVKLEEDILAWWKPPSYNVVDKINQLDKEQFEFMISFLNIEFSLNEIYLNKEIKEAILLQVKELLQEVEIDKIGPLHSELKDSKILYKKRESIINKIRIVENKIYKNESSKIIFEELKSIIFLIQELNDNFSFQIWVLNFLKFEVPKFYKEIRFIYSENPNIYSSEKEKINQKLKFLKNIETETFSAMMDLKISLASKNLKILNNDLIELLKKIKLNNSAFNFIEKYESQIKKLIFEFETKKDYLISEIERFEVKDKKIRVSEIKKRSLSVINQLRNYEKKKQETFQKNTPYELSVELSKVVDLYKEYISFIKENIKDVDSIIKETDKVNQIVAKMNVELLDIETKISKLPRNIIFKQKKEFEKLQDMTSKIIYAFQNNTAKIDAKNEKIILETKKRISFLREEINKDAFLFNYIQWVIVELNKYSNSSDKFALLLDRVEENYHKGNAKESLRISKQITDLYKIYE